MTKTLVLTSTCVDQHQDPGPCERSPEERSRWMPIKKDLSIERSFGVHLGRVSASQKQAD